jgi:pimeloyl-ACP methyl ester carboxylesterase
MTQPHNTFPRFSLFRPAYVLVTGLILALLLAGTQPALAQEKKKTVSKPEEKKIEEVTLTSKDGWAIRATYYPGPEAKTTVPFILVHDWEGNRTDMHGLADFLQGLGHAVIVPDLRGHGSSATAPGADKPLDLSKMNRGAIESVVLDIEAAKNYLLQRNNEGKLNIEQLCVVGTGFGASLATLWAVNDWAVRDLPTYKMGRDVKALILVSPLVSFKGVTVNEALKARDILSKISVMTMVGFQDTRRYTDAKRVYKALEKARGDADELAIPFVEADTTLQGKDLLYAAGVAVNGLRTSDWIRSFVDERLVKQAGAFPWADRTSPLK